MAQTPKINKDECSACVLCTTICDQVFKMSDDGMNAEVIPLAPEKYEALKAEIEEAMQSCPSACIVWAD
ncbi:hypothetical protein AUK40_02075 [Candidatus Wirthbacteria bacterium CG2_30_54_11]|uniref:4Fe-4S ferredoxin-type domain-containing protein n=1 Tax=Candidatus Wirthbacteria bacterium CG2_30_54_11 TaxID=1817892 RepID=A0A1J5J0K4_9BACT|nr:MAG: hypothetical protein AUK40_02075 [Candidatus Wirthbacteria bacterium CG2_30_54_11]